MKAATTKKIPIVYSTAIRAVSYNQKERKLIVMFTSGKSYEYRKVPKTVAVGFSNAESPGKYFNDKVLGNFLSDKLDEVASPKDNTAKPALPDLVLAEGLGKSARRIVNVLLNKGALTAGEIKQATGNQNDHKRLSELRTLGIVKVIGTDTCGVTGKIVTVWNMSENFMNF